MVGAGRSLGEGCSFWGWAGFGEGCVCVKIARSGLEGVKAVQPGLWKVAGLSQS